MPPNVTPSPSLDRIPEDAALKSVGARSDSIGILSFEEEEEELQVTENFSV